MSPAPARNVPPIACGLAHVAALSFLAARAAPPLGFPLGLAGGVALARAGQRLGPRQAYGISLAAVLELVAIVGPARLGGPLTQALTAPLVGWLEGRGVGRPWQVAGCLAIRLTYHAAAYAFFIWIVVGGLDAYAGTYDSLLGRLPILPSGPAAALMATAIGLLVWGSFAAVVQVRVYGRGLRRWPAMGTPPAPARGREHGLGDGVSFDPRAVALAAVVAFAVLLAGTRPWVLGAVTVWLVAAWALASPDRSVVPAAAVLALTLAVSAFAFSALGGEGVVIGAERAARAALLVAVAAWLRGAAGFSGLREVTRRTLGRLRWVPVVPEAAAVFDQLGSGRGLGASARALLGSLRAVRRRPLPVVDAVLTWVAGESSRFAPAAAAGPLALRLRLRDPLLVALAAAPALAFFAS